MAIRSRIAAILVCAILWGPSLALCAEPITLQRGPVQITVAPYSGGLKIEYDGVVVSRGSNIVVTTPPWTPHHYLGPSELALVSAEVTSTSERDVVRLLHRADTGVFEATEEIELTANSVTRRFRGQFHTLDEKCLIQWKMLALNPAPWIGRPFIGTTADGEVRGRVPLRCDEPDMSKAALARDFHRLEVESRIGPIVLEASGSSGILCSDYRASRWADPASPIFWVGESNATYAAGDRIEYNLTLRLPSRAADTPRPTRMLEARRTPTTVVTTAVRLPETPTIIPRPKQARFNGEIYAGEHKPRYEQIDWDRPSGAYRLRVTPEQIVIAAADEEGRHNARQTLRQLSIGSGDARLTRCGEVEDWPSLAVRGVHMFTGGQGPTLHKRLIRDVLGAFKLNHLVLEAEYIEWDSHPEIHHPERGMPKSEVREILAACAASQIEVTPLVMSLGHCQWMFHGGVNLDLAEDPDAQWAYCVTNPKTYDFIDEIYGEAVALFKPKMFHIGHDEYADRGRVPYRESSKPFTVEQLFLRDTLWHHAWFKERDIRVMMWGDMLLAKGEAPDACHAASPESAQELRAALPKDIVIADWHYGGFEPERFTSLKLFQQRGHDVLASTWNRPANIVNFAAAAYQNQSLGLLQTTWAGYSLDEASFKRHMDQYAAYVLAAEAAWNAETPPDLKTFRWSDAFFQQMGMSPLPTEETTGKLIALDDLCNVSTRTTDEDGWFGLGPSEELGRLPAPADNQVSCWLRGVRFDVPKQDRAIALASALTRGQDLPTGVRLAFDATCQDVWLLQATNFGCGRGKAVATVTLEYEDGTVHSQPLEYGVHTFAYNDLAEAPQAPILVRNTNDHGVPIALRGVRIANPHADRPLQAIRIDTGSASGGLLLFGVTTSNGEVTNNGS